VKIWEGLETRMVRGLVAPDIGGGMNPTERRVSFPLCFLVVIWENPLVPILSASSRSPSLLAPVVVLIIEYRPYSEARPHRHSPSDQVGAIVPPSN